MRFEGMGLLQRPIGSKSQARVVNEEDSERGGWRGGGRGKTVNPQSGNLDLDRCGGSGNSGLGAYVHLSLPPPSLCSAFGDVSRRRSCGLAETFADNLNPP